MKKNKFLFLLFSLLVVLVVSSSFIYTNAFSVSYNETINDDVPSVYNDDYELSISLIQPLVANYYYTNVQGAYDTTYSSYLYQYGVSNTILKNGDLSFDAYDDISFSNNTLYNEIIIYNPNNIIGPGDWGIGLYGPLYVKLSEIRQYLNTQYLYFEGVSETQITFCNFSFSYLYYDSVIDSLEEINFVYDEYLLGVNQSLYSDDNLSWFPYELIESSFEIENPYQQDPIIKIDYVYTYFDIGFESGYSNYNYNLTYDFPVISYDNAYNILNNNVFEYNSLSSSSSRFNVGDFIYDSVTSVLNIEILPNFSFMNLLLVCIAVPILIYILKLFLGG